MSWLLMTSISPPRESFAVILGLEACFLSPRESDLWGREFDAKVPYPRGTGAVTGAFLYTDCLPYTPHWKHQRDKILLHPYASCVLRAVHLISFVLVRSRMTVKQLRRLDEEVKFGGDSKGCVLSLYPVQSH